MFSSFEEAAVMDKEDNEDHVDLFQKQLCVRVAVWITCSLSMLGALLIIFSYVCFKGMRSRAREILVHISIMDFLVAASNLTGAAVNFDRFYNCTKGTDNRLPCPASVEYWCKTQAFFAIYCTLGSVLWTMSLSVYLYFYIVHHDTKKAKYSLFFSYLFCYLLPLLLTLWLLLTGKLGYSPYQSAGWCGPIFTDPWTRVRHIYVEVISYDLWVYLTFILVPVLSISVHFYIRGELKSSFYSSNRYSVALKNVEYKFLLIPVAFIILRVWSCTLGILFVYVGMTAKQIPKLVTPLMIFSGIGDSGQGITNAVLFVIFTKSVRDRLLCCRCCRKQRPAAFPHLQETKRLLDGQDSPRNYTGSQSTEDNTPPMTD